MAFSGIFHVWITKDSSCASLRSLRSFAVNSFLTGSTGFTGFPSSHPRNPASRKASQDTSVVSFLFLLHELLVFMVKSCFQLRIENKAEDGRDRARPSRNHFDRRIPSHSCTSWSHPSSSVPSVKSRFAQGFAGHVRGPLFLIPFSSARTACAPYPSFPFAFTRVHSWFHFWLRRAAPGFCGQSFLNARNPCSSRLIRNYS